MVKKHAIVNTFVLHTYRERTNCDLGNMYLSVRTQRVRINTSLSSCTAVPSGVPHILPILRILPICYQIILNDLVLFSKLLQNRYDFNIFNHVSFYYSRAGNRSSDTTVFALPKVRKITTWGSYFYPCGERKLCFRKGDQPVAESINCEKTSRNTVIQQTDGF